VGSGLATERPDSSCQLFALAQAHFAGQDRRRVAPFHTFDKWARHRVGCVRGCGDCAIAGGHLLHAPQLVCRKGRQICCTHPVVGGCICRNQATVLLHSLTVGHMHLTGAVVHGITSTCSCQADTPSHALNCPGVCGPDMQSLQLLGA
jgi:hypothetical protein